MIVKESPLEVIDFFVVQFTFNSIPVKGDNDRSIEKMIYSHKIHIDFGKKKMNKDFDAFFLKAWSNFGKNMSPGYSFFIETVTYYRIRNERKLSRDIIKNLSTYSVLAVSYSNVRSVLNNMSANCPFGKYILPSIDINDIINKKMQIIQERDK